MAIYCSGACAVLSFFQQLKLRKSQADALLNQLARTWEQEFDTLYTLPANSAVVHADETSWSINSVRAFLNDKLTVLFYGVHKDGDTPAQILDKNTFAGLLISDDAAVYQGFSRAQKCRAHLIRN
ncbi:MAG: transposase [Planctomycetaceae bacterium]|nr:transposase [Planctomycetaceae bacterium]